MRRIIRNFVGVMLLALAIAATQIPVEMTQAASEATDFQLDGTTLVKYTGTAYAVSVPAEVKTIGEEAFYGNNTVKIVRLPKNLETIEYGAFSYCSSLQKIQIPDSVTSIGSGAFACCPKLTTVEIGEGVREIGTGVFAGCIALKNISLDKANECFVMDKGVLYDDDMTSIYQYCPGRTESVYTVPDSVTNIGKYAFWGCQNLESVSLNKELMEIAGYSFSNCRSLKTIEIPYSVNSIGAKAFEDCISLEEVNLLPSLRNIHETAFDGCMNLTLCGEAGSLAGDYAEEFNKRDKTTQAEYEDIIQTIYPPQNSETEDTDTTDSNNENMETSEDANQEETGNMLGSTVIVGNQAVVFIDNSSIPVKDGSVADGSNLSDLENAGTQDNQQASDSPEMDEEATSNISSDKKGLHIPKYTWTNGIVADQAYYKNETLTSYKIPDGTTEIGEFAFARSGLTSIDIPEGVTKIGYGAFYHCDNLNLVTLPSTIEEIEPEAFSSTGFVENWKRSGSSSFLTAGDGILLAYNGNETSVIIPEDVRFIAPGVFANHTEITNVTLPDTLVIIGEEAFANCTSLSQVTGGNNVAEIKDRAFAGCPISTIRIGDNVKEIGLLAFDLSESDLRNDQKVAVFQKYIPNLSYEKTARRLSNEEYRDRALKGVSYAVIDSNMSVNRLKDTVLDKDIYGFKGVIVSIDSEADMTVSVRGTTLNSEELAAFELTETIEIFGRQYTLNGKRQLEVLAAENDEKDYSSIGTVLIVNDATDLETGDISAYLSGNTGSYYLRISQSDAAAKRISEAYSAIDERGMPQNLKAYDISLYEQDSNVSISKLGKQTMRITLPLPTELENGTLYIVCTDGNGQLEDVPYLYEESTKERCVTFETNHFSDFGLFTYEKTMYMEGEVSEGKVVIGEVSEKDISPDTGDFIHPKWFLAGGLFFASMAALFIKRKPRKKIV